MTVIDTIVALAGFLSPWWVVIRSLALIGQLVEQDIRRTLRRRRRKQRQSTGAGIGAAG